MDICVTSTFKNSQNIQRRHAQTQEFLEYNQIKSSKILGLNHQFYVTGKPPTSKQFSEHKKKSQTSNILIKKTFSEFQHNKKQ